MVIKLRAIMSTIISDLISLMTVHHNAHGKIVDEVFCREIAAYLDKLPLRTYFQSELCDFIYEYGEDEDDTYMGRDEHGEKQYHTFNPETNWHGRIRKELIALGYYVRYDAMWAEDRRRQDEERRRKEVEQFVSGVEVGDGYEEVA